MSGEIPEQTPQLPNTKPRLRVLLAITLALLGFLSYRSVLAKPQASNLVVEMRSTSLLFMDSNHWCSNSSEGPDGAWYHLRVSNTRENQTYTGLQLTFTAPLSVTIDDPVRYLGNLNPGENQDVFFFVDYSSLRDWRPCGNGSMPVNYSRIFTATITSVDGGMSGVRQFNQTLTADDITSANAGGLYVSHDLGPGAYVGQIMTTTVLYSFGNNSDNTPLFVQPTGNGDFDAGCYRLIGSRVVASDVSGVTEGTLDTIWFPSVSTRSHDVIRMEYAFELRCTSTSTRSYPWGGITSGGNQKYNSNTFSGTSSGSGGVPLPPPQPVEQAIRVNALVSPTLLIDGGVATYTLHIENRANVPIYVNDLHGNLGDGLIYAGLAPNSHVTMNNASVSPAAGARRRLEWFGYPHISFSIPPSGTLGIGQPGILELIYTAEVTATPGTYTTWLTATIGGVVTPPINLPVEVEGTTAVTLAGFTALREAGGVRLLWSTALEIDTIGFHILRQRSPDVILERVTPALIPSMGTGEVNAQPIEYSWLDAGAEPDVDYEYWLEEWTVSGRPETYGPASTRVLQNLTQILDTYLPVLLR